ncbi:flagellar biosynthesis anti-sigma factor FlgM [Parasphingorhabdus cellanae]|uniref:Negative regulator of flagellin synthesis n=1 Tax=Parasphingorhabdus cellanae TaxID=2806553 RepID=A0ABX7T8Z9_9SPHN|nr:flagellar biosynthesis anti-sigma factor FlgM [Parasphingorhabdus cellanae]QTD56488.1 flagellar biosynthesis anti-sigma factor FlgM [Parasphingorhabdus cellanae]
MIDKTNASYSLAIGKGRVHNVGSQPAAVVQESASIAETNSSLVGAVEHMMQQGTPIDTPRIRSIRNAIAGGQYPLDPMKIADNMIAFDRSGADIS